MSEFNPADLGYLGRSPSDGEPDAPAHDASDGSLPRQEREGLPPSYRMRADSHYVDLLSAPSVARDRGQVRTEPAGRPKPEWGDGAGSQTGQAPDVGDEQLLAAVVEGLSTIGSAATILGGDVSPMARRVNVDLVRAEAWRASWMLRGRSVLSGAYRGRMRPEALRPLLMQVSDGFGPECRLTNTSIAVDDDGRTGMAEVDAMALVSGITGAVIWTLGTTEQPERMVVMLRATARDGRLETIEVSQDTAVRVVKTAMPAAGHPGPGTGAWAAALGASVAKAAARLHGADAAFLAGDGPGTLVRFSFGKVVRR